MRSSCCRCRPARRSLGSRPAGRPVRGSSSRPASRSTRAAPRHRSAPCAPRPVPRSCACRAWSPTGPGLGLGAGLLREQGPDAPAKDAGAGHLHGRERGRSEVEELGVISVGLVGLDVVADRSVHRCPGPERDALTRAGVGRAHDRRGEPAAEGPDAPTRSGRSGSRRRRGRASRGSCRPGTRGVARVRRRVGEHVVEGRAEASDRPRPVPGSGGRPRRGRPPEGRLQLWTEGAVLPAPSGQAGVDCFWKLCGGAEQWIAELRAIRSC